MPSGAGFLSSTTPTVCFEDGGRGLCDLMLDFVFHHQFHQTFLLWQDTLEEMAMGLQRERQVLLKKGSLLKLQVGINNWTLSWTRCLCRWSNIQSATAKYNSHYRVSQLSKGFIWVLYKPTRSNNFISTPPANPCPAPRCPGSAIQLSCPSKGRVQPPNLEGSPCANWLHPWLFFSWHLVTN